MEILGILNITEDSFSDGGQYLEINASLQKAEELYKKGAQIIDLGAQSSNIHATPISADLEWSRLYPVLDFLKRKKIPVSVDTYKPSVIQKSIELGVDFINDITAVSSPESLEVIKQAGFHCPNLIIMFSHAQKSKAFLGSNLRPDNIMNAIDHFFYKKIDELIKNGIPEEKLIIDPGMGFFLGENPELSFTVLKNLGILKEKFKRILVSVSRKSFLGNVLGGIPPLERRNATVIAELHAYLQKVDYIRTHEPEPLLQAIRVWELCQ
jgi:dihydropteroate synthase